MPTRAVDLGAVRTRSDLAGALGVPVAAVDVASLASTPCKKAGCSLLAAEWNRGHCVLCSQVWFPGELDQSSDREFQSQIITLDELESMMEAEQLRAAEGGVYPGPPG